MAKLTQQTGTGGGRILALRTGKWRIGRHPTNDFVVDHPSVSQFHAELRVADIGVSFQDLGSTNGSYLDSQRFARGMLGTGQTLRLGVIEFLIEVPQAVIQVPQAAVIVQKHANFLEDGSPACQTHPDISAIHRCLKCDETHCDQCVRRAGLLGRDALIICPTCSGRCGSQMSRNSKKKKKSLLARLAHTLYLTRPYNR